jgi:hypothetical protein
MQRTGLARQYDQLTPRERLQLMLEAQAREDMAEVRRLWETCPYKEYRMRDAAFADPVQAVLKIVLAMSIDLAYYLGQMRMQRSYAYWLPPMLVMASQEAADDLMVETEATPLAAAVEPSQASEDADSPIVDHSPSPEDLCRGVLPKTWERIGRAHEDISQRLAGRVNGILSGLDRLTRRVLGMDAKTVLKAWQPQIVLDIEELQVEAVEPDEQFAKTRGEMVDQLWKKLMAG